MIKKIRHQEVFSILEGLLILVILGIIGFTGWFVWHAKQQTDNTLDSAAKTSQTTPKTTSVKTFAECEKSVGGIVQTSYPEVCVTKSGQRFTQPTTTPTQQYLTIKEWGVKIPLTSADADAYYSAPQKTSTYDYFNLRVHSLDSEPDCTNSDLSVGDVERMTLDQYKQAQQAEEPIGQPRPGVMIDNYYYSINLAQYVCAQQESNQAALTSIRQAFSDATTKIVKE